MKFNSLDELLRTYFDDGLRLPPSLDIRGDKVDKSVKEGLDTIETLATIGIYVSLLSLSSRTILELFYGLKNLSDSEIANRLNQLSNSRRFDLRVTRELRIKTEIDLTTTFEKVGILRRWRSRKNA